MSTYLCDVFIQKQKNSLKNDELMIIFLRCEFYFLFYICYLCASINGVFNNAYTSH